MIEFRGSAQVNRHIAKNHALPDVLEIVPRSGMPINSCIRQLLQAATTAVAVVIVACVSPGEPPLAIRDDAHSSAWTVAFARHAPLAASGGAEGMLRVWRLPKADPVSAWQAHTAPVTAVTFLDDDRVLLSASEDATLARWSLSGELQARVRAPAAVTTMVADVTHHLVYSGHTDGNVRIWRARDLALQGERAMHVGAIRAMDYHEPTRRLATSGEDRSVLVGPLGGPMRELPSPPGAVYSLTFSPGGDTLVGSGWNQLFRWTLTGKPVLHVLPTAHHGLIKRVRYSPDGHELATISRLTDSEVLLLDPDTGSTLRRMRPHDLCGRDVAFSPDGHYLASTSDDASVRFWDLFAMPAKQ